MTTNQQNKKGLCCIGIKRDSVTAQKYANNPNFLIIEDPKNSNFVNIIPKEYFEKYLQSKNINK